MCFQANLAESEPALIDLEMKKLLKAAQTSCLGDATDVMAKSGFGHHDTMSSGSEVTAILLNT